MLRRTLLVCVLTLIAVPCVGAQSTSSAQRQGCSSEDLRAVLEASDPAYAETVALTKELENRGYVVRCVLQSKLSNFFEGQLGAALYRTDRGDFEALFLTKPYTFASVRLIEHADSGRYLYRFEGVPIVTSGAMNCARRTFFATNANRFFVTEGKQLAADLGKVLNSL
jgi:hypothetical protein